MATLPATLRYWAETTPDAPFLCFEGLDGARVRWTYGEFQRSVDELAAGLAAAGLGRGDRCVIHTGNSAGFMQALWAVLGLNAVAVPTIAQYSPDELRYVVDDCGAKIAIVGPGPLREVAEQACSGLDCDLVFEAQHPDGGVSVPSGSPSHPSGAASPPFREPPAFVIYTSGTTSRPKGVMLEHDALAYTARTYAEHFRLQPRDRTLVCLPLFHVNGLALQMLPVVYSGGSMVVVPRFSASRYWGWVRRHEITVGHLVAGPVRLFLAAEEAAEEKDHALRFVSLGMPLDDEEIGIFERRFGAPILMIWGSTETGCGGTLMPMGAARRPGYQNIGQAMRGWEVSVVEPEAEPLRHLDHEETGELLVRSPGVMRGYLGRPEATDEVLLDSGWVRTGDLGWRDRDGYFHFVDRLKDMIKPSGENVAAGEVERVLLTHPEIAKCAVIGVPDPVRMEAVVAVIVIDEGSGLGEEDVRAWCSGRLASFKVPSRVEFRDSLPETSIGKVRKSELRQLLLGSASG